MDETVPTGRMALLPHVVRGACLLLVISCGAVLAQESSGGKAPNAQALSIFELPRIRDGQRAVAALAQMGEWGKAESALHALVNRYPSLPMLHYELAALQIRQDHRGEAIDSLKQAVAVGLPKEMLARDTAFQALREEPAFKQLLTSDPPGQPGGGR